MRTLLTAALVAALPLASANAEIITVKYEGTLPTTELLWDHDVVVAGTITFDTDQVIRSEATFIAYEIIEHKATLEGIGTFVDIGGSVYVYNDQWVDGQYMDPFYSSYVLVAQVIQGFTFVDMAFS